MGTSHPRINLVIEKPLFNTIKELSEENDLSLSSQVRELVIKALEEIEDMGLSRIAEKRLKTFKRKEALTYDEALKRLKRR